MFVGAVSDNFDERIDQKIFHARIVIDNDAVKEETKRYVPIPEVVDFKDEQGVDRMQEQIEMNYNKVRIEVKQLIEDELERIAADPELCHLLGGQGENGKGVQKQAPEK